MGACHQRSSRGCRPGASQRVALAQSVPTLPNDHDLPRGPVAYAAAVSVGVEVGVAALAPQAPYRLVLQDVVADLGQAGVVGVGQQGVVELADGSL